MPDAALIPSILPLSLFEALRNLDTPLEDGLEVVAQEVVARRLGLSGTVAAQIARYREAAARQAAVPEDELVSVLRLVGRRQDAPLVFADAGLRAARYAVKQSGASSRMLLRVSPGGVARRLRSRALGYILARQFGGELHTTPAGPELRMANPLSIVAVPDGGACGFYGAAFGELLRILTGFEGAVMHERCKGRGEPACLWRAHRAADYE